MLRINRDGSIPADNPFFDTATGVNRAIWALGLRNPFTTAIQRSTGRLFINDVGEVELGRDQRGSTRGELRLAAGGRSVRAIPITPTRFITMAVAEARAPSPGAPSTSRPCSPSRRHIAAITSTQITAGDGSEGSTRSPAPTSLLRAASDSGRSQGRPRRRALLPVTRWRTRWADQLLRGRAARRSRCSPRTGRCPSDNRPRSRWVPAAARRSPTSGDATATLIAGANGSSYTRRQPAALGQRRAFRRRRVERFRLGDQRHRAADRHAEHGARCCDYATGRRDHLRGRRSMINYAGTGNDAEDGVLPASAFTWWVDFHHDNHTHPRMPEVSGSKSGTFTIPTLEETSANVFYRFHLQRHGLGRPHALGESRHPAAQVHGHARNQPCRAAAASRWPAGHRAAHLRRRRGHRPQPRGRVAPGHKLGLLILVGWRCPRARYLDADRGYDVYRAVRRASRGLDRHRKRVDPRRRCRDEDRRLPGEPLRRQRGAGQRRLEDD